MAVRLIAAVIFAIFVTSAHVHGNTCDACDECSLSNIEILHDLIDARINATAAAARVEELATASAEERFNATVDDRISAVNATINALNTTVDERITTVSNMVDAYNTSLAKLLSQSGPGKFAEHACCISWLLYHHCYYMYYRLAYYVLHLY